MTGRPTRVGLMGGTFNPVHYGHLRAAEEIAESLGLDCVCFMPSARPPHKAREPLAPYGDRLAMLKLAVADRPGFTVSDLEGSIPGPSYTIETVKAFQKAMPPGAETFFMVGLDSFMTIPSWHRGLELLTQTAFVVFARAGIGESRGDMLTMLRTEFSPDVAWDEAGGLFTGPGLKPIHFRPSCRLAISSTDLRQRLEAGSSVRYLVPEPVRRYIEKHRLYGLARQDSPADLARAVAAAALEHKVADPVLLNLTGLSQVADWFFVATAENARQMGAVADKIIRRARERGARPLGVEGAAGGQWALVDLGPVIAHIFSREARELYDLEGLWADAPREEL